MKTKLYLLCIFLFFASVFLAVYSGNVYISAGLFTLGYLVGGIVGLYLLED